MAKTTVVLIHGGAWCLGSPSCMRAFAERFERAGYRTVSPAYTLAQLEIICLKYVVFSMCLILVLVMVLSPRGADSASYCSHTLVALLVLLGATSFASDARRYHPAQVMDLARVVKSVHDEGEADDKILLVGHSAGAHLAALLALETAWGVSELIAGVIGISGVYSAAALAESWVSPLLTRIVFPTDVYAWPCAAASAPLATPMPKFMLATAEIDWSLQRHASELHDALRQNGADVTWHRYAGTTHFDIRTAHTLDNTNLMHDMLAFARAI